MKQTILIVLLAVSYSVFGEDAGCPSFVAYGYPVDGKKSTIQMCKTQYYNEYDTTCKTPVVIVEHLTRDTLSGDVSRTTFSFHEDTQLPVMYRASPKDYSKTGYDIGHMSPAEDNKVNATVMGDSFNVSNAVPQTPNSNRGVWRELEMNVNLLANKIGDLYVYTGPINSTSPKALKGGECIPDFTYKVIYSKVKNKGAAFIVPNTSDASTKRYTDYEVTIKEVEDRTGINFFPGATDVSFKTTKGADLYQ